MFYQYAAKKVKDPKTNEEHIVSKKIEITPVGTVNVPVYQTIIKFKDRRYSCKHL